MRLRRVECAHNWKTSAQNRKTASYTSSRLGAALLVKRTKNPRLTIELRQILYLPLHFTSRAGAAPHPRLAVFLPPRCCPSCTPPPGVTGPLDLGARGPAVAFLWLCPSPQVMEQRPRGHVLPRPAPPFRWCSGHPRISCLVAPDHLQRTVRTFPLDQSPEGELCCPHQELGAAACRMKPETG